MFSLRKDLYFFLCLISVCIIAGSCQTIDLYEKNTPIPKHQWSSGFKPQFKFEIQDTTSPYDIYVVLRHNEKYNWNNIWLEMTTKIPGDSATRKEKIELALANNKGWIGSAMDDIYEQRVLITPPETGVWLKKGEYDFTIAQIMREDPLQNIMNIGLRVEKKITSTQK